MKTGGDLLNSDDNNDKGGAYNVRAVARALAVLKSFTGKDGQTLAETTVATGLDKGTTRRLLLTLMDNGFVTYDQAGQQYRLGLAIRELAASVTGEFDLRSVALPILNELSSDLHMTAFLAVYDKDEAVCLERVHDMRGIEVHWWPVGGALPFCCGGAPKLLLAYRSEAEIANALKRPLVAMTPKSITDPAKLKTELAKIRSQGFALAIDDVTLGLTALAVPVHGSDGNVACSLSVAGLTPQMAERGKALHVKQLQAAAKELERLIRT